MIETPETPTPEDAEAPKEATSEDEKNKAEAEGGGSITGVQPLEPDEIPESGR